MDSDSGFGPSTGDHGAQASERGAGTLGFAGTATKERRVRAVGLTALAGDEFGNGPRMPMVPGTWEQGSNEPEAPDGSGRGEATAYRTTASNRIPNHVDPYGSKGEML